jgi:hypothetical protein
VHTHTHTVRVGKYTHTPLFISTASEGIKKICGLLDRKTPIFNPLNMLTHALANALSVHKTEARFAERSL